jgi:hypothetical protein
MSQWTPGAILPNLSSKKTVESEVIALAPCTDPRVLDFCAAHPPFKELISRFTNAFAVHLNPLVLIIRNDALSKLSQVEPLASFRDVAALCTIPYARALGLVYPNGGHRISYSNSFWLYPWMLGTDNQHLVASTPAFQGLHVVKEFHGQSSPDLPTMKFSDVDGPLLEVLLQRWKRYYLGKRIRREDRTLFRSLNMAMQAAQLPGGIDVTLYDLGRIIALWVSAFEILAHTPAARCGLRQVYSLLERVSYGERGVSQRRYKAYQGRRTKGSPPPGRTTLPCWLYGKLYRARCDFLHGNPVRKDRLSFTGAEASLFWIAPCLYRMALTGFLKLSPIEPPSPQGPQGVIERALLRARKHK